MSLESVEIALNSAASSMTAAGRELTTAAAVVKPAAEAARQDAAGTRADALAVAATREELMATFGALGLQPPVAHIAGLHVTASTFTVQTVVGGETLTFRAKATAVPFDTGNVFDTTKWDLVSNLTREEVDPYLKATPYPAARAGVVASSGDQLARVNAALAAAVALGADSVALPAGPVFVSAEPTNPRGLAIIGELRMTAPINPAGTDVVKINSKLDLHKYFFGREYMAPWYNNLLASHRGEIDRPLVGAVAGDSTATTVGTSPGFRRNELLMKMAEASGLQGARGIQVLDRGHSGMTAEHWRVQYAAEDMALDLDFYVPGYGANDPGWLKNMTAPPIDSGRDYTAPGGIKRRDVNDVLTSIDGALAVCRAAKSWKVLPILLLPPVSMFDSPNGRDALYFEAINDGIRRLARKHKCAFVDVYAYWRDSSELAGVGEDDIMPDPKGRGIHPNDAMNMDLMGLVSELLFPRGLRDAIGAGNVYNIGGGQDAGDPARPPSFYRYGVTVSRALKDATHDFPIDGSIVTVRSLDETVMQTVYPFLGPDMGTYAVRFGRAAGLAGQPQGWGEWVFQGSKSVNVNLESGFLPGLPGSGQGALRVARSGSGVDLEGFATVDPPRQIVAGPGNGQGLPLGLVPETYRNRREANYRARVVYYTTADTFEYGWADVLPDGRIILRTPSVSASVLRVYVYDHWNTMP